MTTNKAFPVLATQPDFTNLAEDKPGSIRVPPTFTTYPPPQLLRVHPTPPPSRISPPSPKPVAQRPQPSPEIPSNSHGTPPGTDDIFDYMIWSRVHLVLGAIILGIPSLILSMTTRRYKREGNVASAKRFSSITLGVNIFVSFLFMCGLVYLITHFNSMT